MNIVSINFFLRRPVLDGDNWWRGHATAFLKDVNLSQDVLRRGRVCKVCLLMMMIIVVLYPYANYS